MKIWRNDDIGEKTDVALLEEVHKELVAAGQKHTVALVTKNMGKNKAVVQFLKDHLEEFDIQVHCHSHDKPLPQLDGEEIEEDLKKAKNFITKNFGVAPTILFPPWNHTSPTLEAIAASLGLRVSYKKVSLSQFIRVEGDVSEEAINFHSWSEEERKLLPQALKFAK